jgi:hypothetical protein
MDLLRAIRDPDAARALLPAVVRGLWRAAEQAREHVAATPVNKALLDAAETKYGMRCDRTSDVINTLGVAPLDEPPSGPLYGDVDMDTTYALPDGLRTMRIGEFEERVMRPIVHQSLLAEMKIHEQARCHAASSVMLRQIADTLEPLTDGALCQVLFVCLLAAGFLPCAELEDARAMRIFCPTLDTPAINDTLVGMLEGSVDVTAALEDIVARVTFA